MKVKGFYGDIFDILPKKKKSTVEVTKTDGRKFYLRLDDLAKVMQGIRLMAEMEEAIGKLEYFKHINNQENV